MRISTLHIFLGVFDLIGIVTIGVIASLSIRGLQSYPPDSRIGKFLEIVGISNLPFQTQAAILGVAASLILMTRTISSYLVSKNTYYFLSNISNEISRSIFSKLTNSNLLTIKGESPHRVLHSATGGVTGITTGVISPLTMIFADFSLVIIISIGIGIFDPVLVMTIIIIFSIILTTLLKLTNGRSIAAARILMEKGIESGELSLEFIESYREAFVRNRRFYYFNRISEIRKEVSGAVAEQSWLPNISKYTVEISITLGSLAIAAIQFLTKNAVDAVGAFAVFIAAGSRITPALLRIQQNTFIINSQMITSKPTLELFSKLEEVVEINASSNDLITKHENFYPEIEVFNLSFSYPNVSIPTLKDVNIKVSPGSSIAIVGTSGVGKSTLVDLLLGLLTPSAGKVRVSGINPDEAISTYPGAIGYVPQDISIYNGSIRSNLGLGFNPDQISDAIAYEALKKANLYDFVSKLPGGLDHSIDARGSNLSAGQRQRLGIARALITSPRLLILDEATSSLDNETEKIIIDSLVNLNKGLTVVIVAHRLSALRNLDCIVYLENGEIKGQGDFDQLRSTIPNFDHQATIAGL
jgi:ABC-type multidrug transport system fused ATPase/permease subunit